MLVPTADLEKSGTYRVYQYKKTTILARAYMQYSDQEKRMINTTIHSNCSHTCICTYTHTFTYMYM